MPSSLAEGQRTFVDDLLVRYDPRGHRPAASASSARAAHLPKGYQLLLDVAFAHDIRLASALGPPPIS